MIPILVVICLVAAALFGAVMLSRIHATKEVDVFECGIKPFQDSEEFHCNTIPAILFLVMDAIVILLIALQIDGVHLIILTLPAVIGIVAIARIRS